MMRRMTKTAFPLTMSLTDYLRQHNVHCAILLNPSNLTLRIESSVIFLLLNLSILFLLTSPDLNANEVVVHVSAGGVAIFPLIFVATGLINGNNSILTKQ